MSAAPPGRAPHRVRFGETVFTWDERTLARSGRPALVTQVGRSFQQQHPDVPVLLDHGRHLVVTVPDVDVPHGPPPGAPPGPAPAAEGHLDWRIEPLPAGGVVVDRPLPRRRAPDPFSAAVLAELSEPAFGEVLAFLAGLPTRHSTGEGFQRAADHVAGLLAAGGWSVTRPPITVGDAAGSNVVADRAGVGAGRGLVLLTAHLDSVNLSGGPAAPAPGADDNGSGAAGVLEMARVLAGHAWRHDLRVVLFGGEEQGLHGSRQFVAALPPGERERIRAVLNLDMVGRLNTADPTVLLEGAPRSVPLINALAIAAATWTALLVETSLTPFASDHVPFLDAGIPAVLTIEGADSANHDVHTDRDVLATVDPALAMQILRMGLAALVGWLEPAGAGAPMAATASTAAAARTPGDGVPGPRP